DPSDRADRALLLRQPVRPRALRAPARYRGGGVHVAVGVGRRRRACSLRDGSRLHHAEGGGRRRDLRRRRSGAARAARRRRAGGGEEGGGVVGGWVDPNESPYETAVREAREEVGLDVRVDALADVIWRPASVESGPHSTVSVVLLCSVVGWAGGGAAHGEIAV